MTLEHPTRRGGEPGADPAEDARPDLLGRIAAPLAAVSRAPLTSYHVVMVVTCLLTLIGLGMVLSSSNVLAFSGGGTPFDIFLRQALFVLIGSVGFVLALRMRIELLKKLALPGLLVSIVLLVAVLGTEPVNGSRSWIDFGFFSIQPAEIAKLAFIVWASGVVAKRMRTGYWLDLLFPAVVGYGAVAVLIVLAPDLGMATAVTIAFLCLLWFAGYPARHFLLVIAFGAAVFGVLAVTFAYRFERIQTFFSTFVGDFSNPQGAGYQSYQGMLSLADGGLFGVGLGQSSAKWFYLPEATNDFIFAIIGEELGWFGAAIVVSLYLALGWAGMRIALRSVDPFRRLLAGTITATIVLQAFINVGYVVGLLPVSGLQLPLISNGGTSAVVTLTSLGLLANCARHEPEAISAILSAPGRAARRRWFSLPDPRPYTPERPVPAASAPGRSSAGARRYGEPVTRREQPPAARRGRPAEARRRGQAQPAPVPRPGRAATSGPAYESMPGPADETRGRRRGAAPVTGRTARTVRGREEQRDRTRGATPEPGSRRASGPPPGPSPIHRGRRR